MAFTLIREGGFEPKPRFPCPDYKMEPWLPPHDHAELSRRAARIGISTREYAMQAVRFAMAQEKAA
jgi:hypothetical protein